MYTFEHACSIKKSLSVLANNDQLKGIIITNFNKLEYILADPECEFTQQLRINYDLIEVLNGWCFSLSQRRFVQNPINPLTPGAFCEKGVSRTFWLFLGWISAKLALIWSKMHFATRPLAFSSPEPRFFWSRGLRHSKRVALGMTMLGPRFKSAVSF